jgi:HSP20 family protein
MADTASKLPVKVETKSPARGGISPAWQPLESLRREVDRLFEDFDGGFWRAPFRRSLFDMQPFFGRPARWATEPAVDVVEKEKVFEIRAELPGMDEKNIEVKFANGGLTIKGEKHEEKEEKKQDYYLHERKFGSFERSFALPDGVDPEKIEASFKRGILTVILPKKPEAIKAEKKIEVKAEH